MPLSEWYEAKIIADVSGVKDIAELVGVLAALHEAFEGLKAGVGRGDYIRDFTLSLDTFSGSAQKATESLEFFRRKAKETRDDAMDLAEAFRDILPISKERGFTQGATQEITVLLSQLATMYDKTLDQMMQSYRRVLAGGRIVPGSNPLLNILGISSEQIKEMNFQELISRMQDVIDRGFAPFGQSAESTFKKIKLQWEDTFGEGFNQAMNNGRTGFQAILDLMTSDGILSKIHTLGEDVGKMVGWFNDLGDKGTYIRQKWDDLADSKGGSLLITLLSFSGNPLSKYNSAVFSGLGSGAGFVDQLIGGAARDQANQATTAGQLQMGGAILGANNLGSVARFGGLISPSAMSESQLAAGMGRAMGTFSPEVLSQFIRDISQEAGKGFVEVSDWAAAWDDASKAMAGAHEKMKGVPDSLISQALAARRLKEELKAIEEEWKASHLYTGFLNTSGRPTIGPYQGWDQFDLSNPGLKKSMPYLLNQVDPAVDARTLAKMKENAEAAADAFAQQLQDNQAFLKAFYNAQGSISSAIEAGFKGGVSGFLKSLGDDLPKTLEESLNKAFDKVFGTPDKSGVLQGGMVGPAGARAFQIGAQGLQSFGGGYGAGLSGAPGSRTAGVVEGFLSGTSTGNVYVAIATAVLAAIGGAIGASQRQADYQFGVPAFDDAGLASIGGSKNITPNQLRQMQSQLQSTFDTFYNGFVGLVVKLGGQLPGLGSFSGVMPIQPNPSGHFMEHFQQFLQEGLPQKIADPFMPIVRQGFMELGLSADKFTEIMGRLAREDPKTALQGWLDLADALISFKKAGEVFGGEGYVDFVGGPRSGAGGIGLETGNVVRGPWAMKDRLAAQMQTSFLSDLDVNDDRIKELQKSLNELVGPQQLAAAKELGSLVFQKAQAEKDAVKQLIQLALDTRQAFKDQSVPYQVMGMVGPDGKPDNQAIANFYRNQAQRDLVAGQQATNPADLAAARARFFGDVNSAAAAMTALGINPKDISKWALDSLQAGAETFGSRIDEVGRTLGDAGKKFWDDLQPTLDKFKTVLTDSSDPLGQFNDDVDGTHAPIMNLIEDLKTLSVAIQSATSAASSSASASYIRGNRNVAA